MAGYLRSLQFDGKRSKRKGGGLDERGEDEEGEEEAEEAMSTGHFIRSRGKS